MYNKTEYRGLVKWYDRGLQNLWREFDSLIPCLKKTPGKPTDNGFSGVLYSYIVNALYEDGTGIDSPSSSAVSIHSPIIF